MSPALLITVNPYTTRLPVFTLGATFILEYKTIHQLMNLLGINLHIHS